MNLYIKTNFALSRQIYATFETENKRAHASAKKLNM